MTANYDTPPEIELVSEIYAALYAVQSLSPNGFKDESIQQLVSEAIASLEELNNAILDQN